jgi:hypothetical protein
LLTSVAGSFFAFLRRCRQNNIRHSTMIKAARPPTTPPAIAPMGFLFEVPPAAAFVLAGSDRVAVRVAEAGLVVL